ncbi:MAG: serine hydrolase [Gammaproteobacteria bacterium]|nr:serine hydrolase [Gammaproteobacteria bacterium]MDP2348820.1 serine hydrolase [Gammaproteobacteria bacterium]
MAKRYLPYALVERCRAVLLHALVVLALNASTLSLAAETDIDFEPAHQAASALPRLHSLLISHEGELLLERYYRGARADRPANMKSASKTVISGLVGIALDRGLLTGLDQTLGDFFPQELAGDENSVRRAITIEDLLTMRAGLQSTSNRNYGNWVLSSNWVSHALSRPLVAEPGTEMIYSTGSTHLLSAILAKVSDTTTKQFAEQVLARPLGFSMAYWPADPQGIHFGGNDMEMTPRQMLAFGELYINAGRANGRINSVAAGRQVISEHWVNESLQIRTPSPRGEGRYYGYGWWYRELAGHDVYFAWGYGGQFIFVAKDLNLVVAITSDSLPGDSRRGHLDRIYDLVERYIVGPVAVSATLAAVSHSGF